MTTLTLDQKVSFSRTHFRDIADLKFVIDSEYLESRLQEAQSKGEYVNF